MFQIYAEHSDGNIETFWLLLSRAYAEPRLFLPNALPHWQEGWGSMGQPEQVTPTDQLKGIFQAIWQQAQFIKQGEEGRKGSLSGAMEFVFPSHC